jgi:hypothetical protein
MYEPRDRTETQEEIGRLGVRKTGDEIEKNSVVSRQICQKLSDKFI